MSDKNQWPELVGRTGEEAKAAIQSQNADLQVQIIEEGSPVTRDLRMNRVRIFVKDGKVTSPPRTG